MNVYITIPVRYLPCRGSQAVIMFLASNICCVSSGTVTARYCWASLRYTSVTSLTGWGDRPGHKRGKPWHEEVQSGERDHVDRQFSQVCIELAWEPEAGGHSGHGDGHQVVQVSISRRGQLQCPENTLLKEMLAVFHSKPEADVIQSFIVNTESLICIFNQLMD